MLAFGTGIDLGVVEEGASARRIQGLRAQGSGRYPLLPSDVSFTPMFEELRSAWREAVENFYRELRSEPGDGSGRLGAMRRDHAAAVDACRRVERERDRARAEVAHEREEEAVCRRRQAMAVEIDDGDTAEVAGRFAEKHARRVAVLEQVVMALAAEADLRRHDVEEMRAALAEAESAAEKVAAGGGAAGLGGGAAEGGGAADEASSPTDGPAGPAAGARRATSIFESDEQDAHFRRLEREERERAAEARLEELKRKMR